MDSFKIVFDSKGKAFESIYILPNIEELVQPFTSISNNLSHTRILGSKDEEKNDDELAKPKEIKKKLFKNTMDLLKIVKFDFIEASLAM
jgi:hypothetical protein